MNKNQAKIIKGDRIQFKAILGYSSIHETAKFQGKDTNKRNAQLLIDINSDLAGQLKVKVVDLYSKFKNKFAVEITDPKRYALATGSDLKKAAVNRKKLNDPDADITNVYRNYEDKLVIRMSTRFIPEIYDNNVNLVTDPTRIQKLFHYGAKVEVVGELYALLSDFGGFIGCNLNAIQFISADPDYQDYQDLGNNALAGNFKPTKEGVDFQDKVYEAVEGEIGEIKPFNDAPSIHNNLADEIPF